MDVDNLLRRNLLDGAQYAHLIPAPSKEKTFFGTGDTFDTVALIKKMVAHYYQQCQNLAPVLQGDNLRDTCEQIHWFLYNHLQYKSDNTDQNLRTPANSWANRQNGIDCKSYSLFASCILANLGIVHYIRQIKQPSLRPENFSHVYIIVPNDQQTHNIANGYYTIDGTINTTKEPVYTMAQDTKVELPHYGLNAPAKKPSAPKNCNNKILMITAAVFGGLLLTQKK